MWTCNFQLFALTFLQFSLPSTNKQNHDTSFPGWSYIGLYVEYSRHAVGQTCNVAGIFVQGDMPIMWNACTSVLLVTWMIAMSSKEIYTLIQLCICTWTNFLMWHLREICVVGIHTYLYTNIFTCLSIYIHTYLCANMHAYTHACLATHIHTHAYTFVHVCINTNVLTCI